MLNKAVLFLVFNRPDTTKRVFDAIKEARPPRLYIAADGFRKNKSGEQEKCDEVKKIVSEINWDCEVKTLFQDKNLGCGVAPSEAINWFFEQEEDGIILEDDCVPHQTFFSYCETLLDYYKDNEKIMHIAGSCHLDFEYGDASYYFATIQHCWGWASWRRAWVHCDFTLQKYPIQMIEEKLFYMYSNNEMKDYWKDMYTEMKKNTRIDIWDYQWTLSIMANNGLCINPNVNLVSNIGFAGDGTHTFGENHPFANLPTYPLIAITHPNKIKRNMFIDEYIMKDVFGVFENKRLDRVERDLIKIKRLFTWLRPLYKCARKIKNIFRSKFR